MKNQGKTFRHDPFDDDGEFVSRTEMKQARKANKRVRREHRQDQERMDGQTSQDQEILKYLN